MSLGIVRAVAGVMGTNSTVAFFKVGDKGFTLMIIDITVLIGLVPMIARGREEI